MGNLNTNFCDGPAAPSPAVTERLGNSNKLQALGVSEPEAHAILDGRQPVQSGLCFAPSTPRCCHPHGRPGRIVFIGWQAERARVLRRACRIIEKHRASGLVKAIRRAARRIAKRTYQGGRKIQMSEKTLQRVYYAWRAAGQSDSAFVLRYRPGRGPSIPSQLTARFRNECLLAVSMADAYRKVRAGRESFPTQQAFCQAIPARQRAVVRELHRARRQAFLALAT